MAKAVVTGGAGFIGSHIVDALVERGFETHVIDNYAAGKRGDRMSKSATYHEVDIREYDAIAPVIAGAQYVFHEAALPRVQFSIEHPIETFAVNVTGFVNILRAAHQGGVKRVVAASSGSVYGDQATMPLVETMTPQPKSPYGLQKYISEVTAKLWSEVYGLETASLRYFNVYGTRMDPNGAYALAIAKFIKFRTEGKPLTIWGDGSHTRDFTHVSDVVSANLLAAESPNAGKGDVFNIGAGRNISVNEVARLIGGPVVNEPERLEPAHALADNTKARTMLGWEPKMKFEDAIVALKKEAGLA
ncbi:MAG: NAD-dependent epimerase/dehydratase family protein [Candidatus Kaiserbacteria bacterium]|nr:NAD-dependent epimerase/dehydratase family protein [Candidatus Kaiserbacteria bacterium]